MPVEASAPSATDPATLWGVLRDVNAWPNWCPAVTFAQLDGPFAVGSTARVVQAGLRPESWTIEEVEPARSFRWRTAGPGFAMVTTYALEPAGPGTVVRISTATSGRMAWAVGLIVRRPLRRQFRQQAAALAAH